MKKIDMNNLMKGLQLCFIMMLFGSCVETFTFDTSNEESFLVVDGYISDVSYNETLLQPMNPKYFEVRLKMTNVVGNTVDTPVPQAQVELVDDLGEHWDYEESTGGVYRLYFEDFEAEEGKSYKLSIKLSNGEHYESNLETLPQPLGEGEVIYEEDQIRDYRIVAGTKKIVDINGVSVKFELPNEPNATTTYNRWDFVTTYGFIARLNDNPSDPNFRCWVSEDFFFDEFTIQKGESNGGLHDLFFFDTGSEVVHEGVSVLIRQQGLSELNYQFWEDLDNQKKQADLFAPPPYNLNTNMHPVGHDKEVYGYFGVLREKFYRWQFSHDMVSYPIIYPESLINSCNIPRPPWSCWDCTRVALVTRSTVTNARPIWWND